MKHRVVVCLLLISCFLCGMRAQSPVAVEKIDLYQTGSDKFEALLADMMQAKHHLHVEYFIFANDQIAGRMLQVMRKKAREGVKVRLIIDGYYDVMREYNYHKHLGMMRGDGIDVHIYSPYTFPYVNHNFRDHRKIVIIDGKVGYTGGFNVADYNIHGKPGIYGSYVDTQVRLEGAVVEQLEELFLHHFTHVGGEAYAGDEYFPSQSEAIESGDAPRLLGAAGSARIVSRGRHDGKRRQLRKSVIQVIDGAKHDLYVLSPYLLPTPGVRMALCRAIRRGVKVHIMFSEKGDTPVFDRGNISYARSLQRRGADVWLYQDGFQHSKVLVADGKVCMVGSMNLDYRALRMNEEVAAVFENEEAASWLENAFFDDMDKCKVMNDEFYKNLPLKTRISGNLINYLLSWAL